MQMMGRRFSPHELLKATVHWYCCSSDGSSSSLLLLALVMLVRHVPVLFLQVLRSWSLGRMVVSVLLKADHDVMTTDHAYLMDFVIPFSQNSH